MLCIISASDWIIKSIRAKDIKGLKKSLKSAYPLIYKLEDQITITSLEFTSEALERAIWEVLNASYSNNAQEAMLSVFQDACLNDPSLQNNMFVCRVSDYRDADDFTSVADIEGIGNPEIFY